MNQTRKRRFRQRDLTTAIKAVLEAGCTVARVEVDLTTDRITIFTVDRAGAKELDEVEQWFAKQGVQI